MRRHVTQRELARCLGISQRSVSMALRGQPGLSRQTRARVLATAAQVGYRPHSPARAVRSGRTGCFALVLSTSPVSSLLPPHLLAGIQEALRECDYHLLVVPLPDEKLTSENFIPKSLRELAADGLLLNYNAFIPPRMVELIQRYRIPAVWINSKQSYDCVHPDDLGAGTLVTRRLIEQGHRRIAYVDLTHPVDGVAGHYSATDRWAGYVAAMETAGLSPSRIKRCHSDAPAADCLRRILASPDRPTAVLCYSGRESRLVYHVAGLLGLQVPEDLSIVRFGAAPFEDLGMDFAVAVIPERAMGRQAVHMLRVKVERPEERQPTLALPFTLHEGQTMGPPSADILNPRETRGGARVSSPSAPNKEDAP